MPLVSFSLEEAWSYGGSTFFVYQVRKNLSDPRISRLCRKGQHQGKQTTSEQVKSYVHWRKRGGSGLDSFRNLDAGVTGADNKAPELGVRAWKVDSESPRGASDRSEAGLE